MAKPRQITPDRTNGDLSDADCAHDSLCPELFALVRLLVRRAAREFFEHEAETRG